MVACDNLTVPLCAWASDPITVLYKKNTFQNYGWPISRALNWPNSLRCGATECQPFCLNVVWGGGTKKEGRGVGVRQLPWQQPWLCNIIWWCVNKEVSAVMRGWASPALHHLKTLQRITSYPHYIKQLCRAHRTVKHLTADWVIWADWPSRF